MWVAELQQGLKGLNLICSMIFFFFLKSHFLRVQRQFIFWAFFRTQGGAFSLRHFL